MQWTAPLHCDLIFDFPGTRSWNKNPEPEPLSIQGPILATENIAKEMGTDEGEKLSVSAI